MTVIETPLSTSLRPNHLWRSVTSTTLVVLASGTPPMAGDPGGMDPQFGGPHQQVEVGQPQDMFAVYRGKREHPLDASAVWHYGGENALRSPGVPAVDVFRKLVLESEKQQAEKP